MNTPKITREQVAQAIDFLAANNLSVSAEKIRAHIGRGSKQTVLRLMKEVQQDTEIAEEAAQANHHQRMLKAYPVPNDLESKIGTMQDILSALPLSLAELQCVAEAKGRNAVEDQMIGQAAQYDKHIASLQNQVDEMRVECTSLQDELTETNSVIEVLRGEKTELERELAEAGKTILTLEGKLAALGPLSDRIAALADARDSIVLDDVPKKTVRRKRSPLNGATKSG